MSSKGLFLRQLEGGVRDPHIPKPMADTLEEREGLDLSAWRVAFNRGLIAETAGNARGAIEQYEISLAERPEYRAAASRKAGLLATAGEAAF